MFSLDVCLPFKCRSGNGLYASYCFASRSDDSRKWAKSSLVHQLASWWTKEDFAHFRESSERLAKQYDAYSPFPDLHLNGKQTSSENIADVAGLSAAFDAYR